MDGCGRCWAAGVSTDTRPASTSGRRWSGRPLRTARPTCPAWSPVSTTARRGPCRTSGWVSRSRIRSGRTSGSRRCSPPRRPSGSSRRSRSLDRSIFPPGSRRRRTVVAPLNREDDIYPAVEAGELTIDSSGRIWRVAARRWDRWTSDVRTIPCAPRRAENETGKYLQVRVMFGGVRVHALAHRLVWRHVYGSIPQGLTVNHKNGRWADNRPVNLELATPAEQTRHAREVLRRGRLDQFGSRNSMSKLTTEQVQEICSRRADGELLTALAAEFGVAQQTISKIARGERRSRG